MLKLQKILKEHFRYQDVKDDILRIMKDVYNFEIEEFE